MLITLALLIPILTAIALFIYKREYVTWWEYVIVLVVPFMCVLGIKAVAQASLMYTDEYWTTMGTKAAYYEAWDEEVPCEHPEYETDTDSEGNTTTRFVGYEHAYDVDDHPPIWILQDNLGQDFSISKSKFEELCSRWNNKTFKDLNRDYHSIDGDMYFTVWDSTFSSIESISTTRKYKNKIKHSDSLFQFKKVDLKDQLLFKYKKPDNYYKCNFIYGAGTESEQLLLRRWNTVVGSKRKAVLMVIVYYNKPMEVSYNQEAYWKGGNKNEFILCVSVDEKKKIQWTRVLSWTKETTLKAQVEREIQEMETFDLTAVINYLGTTVEGNPRCIRRDFEEFNYISVPVPLWGSIFALLVSLIISFIIADLVAKNEYNAIIYRENRRLKY